MKSRSDSRLVLPSLTPSSSLFPQQSSRPRLPVEMCQVLTIAELDRGEYVRYQHDSGVGSQAFMNKAAYKCYIAYMASYQQLAGPLPEFLNTPAAADYVNMLKARYGAPIYVNGKYLLNITASLDHGALLTSTYAQLAENKNFIADMVLTIGNQRSKREDDLEQQQFLQELIRQENQSQSDLEDRLWDAKQSLQGTSACFQHDNKKVMMEERRQMTVSRRLRISARRQKLT